MQELKSAINEFLKKAGLEKGVSQNTSPEKVESGTLYIKTSNPTWRQELVFKKTHIIKKLNNKLGKNTIKEIGFI